MSYLGVDIGDFIEVKGPRGTTILQVWPLPPGDKDEDIIRIDGLVREAIGVSVGDAVEVRKATNVQPASKVVLAPTEPIRFSRDFVDYVKEHLIRKPVTRGEIIIIPLFGGEVRLVVAYTEPGVNVYVAEASELTIREEPIEPTGSREVLESIVAQVLRSLGFQVWVNRRMPARRGAPIEVDVWAEKRAGGSKFKVYVSCKNWNRDVDRSVVDEEFGRVFNLQEVPHLRVLVVKSMTKPAKEVADADGFYVIELGEKATDTNLDKVYTYIYKALSDLFTAIAPPQLQEIAKRVEETAKELNRIAQQLQELLKSYSRGSLA
jgi:hypothetical protein